MRLATLAWFHRFAGIAGDMALGSLLDAGADLDEVQGACWPGCPGGAGALRGRARPARAGIAADPCSSSRVTDDPVVVRTHAHIVGLIEEARLADLVRHPAPPGTSFVALAEVEGRLHRRPPEQVHFHEVGARTTPSSTSWAPPPPWRSSASTTSWPRPWRPEWGRCALRMDFSPILLPQSSSCWLASRRGVAILAVELTTPTGAAILASLSAGYGPMPPMRVAGQGFGAGARELDELPNCTQVVIGTADRPPERCQQP